MVNIRYSVGDEVNVLQCGLFGQLSAMFNGQWIFNVCCTRVQETDEDSKLIRENGRKQSKFFVHVMRTNTRENFVTTGTSNREKAKGKTKR